MSTHDEAPRTTTGEYLKFTLSTFVGCAVAAPSVALGYYSIYLLVTLIGNN